MNQQQHYMTTGTTTTSNLNYFQQYYPQVQTVYYPYPLIQEPTMSKFEQAFKVVAVLIDKGYLKKDLDWQEALKVVKAIEGEL